MRKWMKFCVCGLAAVMLISGCGDKKTNTNTTTEAATSAETETLVQGDGLSKVTKLGNYKGIEITKPDTTVTDEEVQEQIDLIVANNPNVEEITDRPIAEGDTVNLTYVGKREDGTEFDNGTVDLLIGSGQFIDGFEDGMIGAKKGENLTLNLTFPEEYFETSLAGKPAVFDVTVNTISLETEAEFTDAFINELTGGEYATTDAYRQYIKGILEEQKESAAEQDMLYELLDKIAGTSEFELTEADKAAEAAEIKDYYNSIASMYGVTIEQLIGKTMEEVDEIIQEGVTQTLQWTLIMDKIAEEEKIEITEEDYEKLALESGYESLEQLRSLTSEENLRESALIEKLVPVLIGYSVVK